MKKILWSIAGVVIIGLLVVSIYRQEKKNIDNPIKIGAVISLTGFAAPWGEFGKNGMELAVKNINDAGGINGRMVELRIEDDRTDGKQAVSSYNKLVSVDGVDGVIGGVFDFTALPIIPLAKNNNTALISPSNFRIVGGFDLNDQSFVMMTDFNKVLKQLDSYIKKEGIKKLAVVHFQSSWGNEIAKTLDSVMKENGSNGIVDEGYAKIGDNDFRTIITKLKSQKVEAVFLDMVGNDPINFLSQSKELGFNPKIISYNGVTDSFAQEKDKSLLNGIIVLNWEISSPEFTKIYQDKYGVIPTKSADKYFTAVYVMANAIANSQDKAGVASYISSNTFSTPNGLIKFNSDHVVENIPIEIEVIKGGERVKY